MYSNGQLDHSGQTALNHPQTQALYQLVGSDEEKPMRPTFSACLRCSRAQRCSNFPWHCWTATVRVPRNGESSSTATTAMRASLRSHQFRDSCRWSSKVPKQHDTQEILSICESRAEAGVPVNPADPESREFVAAWDTASSTLTLWTSLVEFYNRLIAIWAQTMNNGMCSNNTEIKIIFSKHRPTRIFD